MTVLKILYQDEDLVVVSKPEKMLTHRTEIANGDTEFALQLLNQFKSGNILLFILSIFSQSE